MMFCDGVRPGLGVNSVAGVKDEDGVCARGEGGEGEGVSVIVGKSATDAIVGVSG
jgi:hypothetical protein